MVMIMLVALFVSRSDNTICLMLSTETVMSDISGKRYSELEGASKLLSSLVNSDLK